MSSPSIEEILTPNTETRKHARHSPSTLEYKEVCPLWVNTSKDEQESTAAGEEGTLLHSKVENEDLSGLDKKRQEYVKLCLDYKDKIHEDLFRRYSKVSVTKEIEVKTPGDQFGFFDLLMVGGSEGHLFDWKFGWEPVAPAETNAQMWAYIIGAWDAYRDWETDRKSTRLNSSHSAKSRMPSSA